MRGMSDFSKVMYKIAEKERLCYTGVLKFGFQDGVLTSYVESDVMDLEHIVEGIEREYLVLKIKKLCNPYQNGGVTMAYKNGKLVGGCHSRTWAGKTLREAKERWGCRNVSNAESQ